ARLLARPLGQVPANLQAVFLDPGGRCDRTGLGRRQPARRPLFGHRTDRDGLLLRALPDHHAADRQIRKAATTAGFDLHARAEGEALMRARRLVLALAMALALPAGAQAADEHAAVPHRA